MPLDGYERPILLKARLTIDHESTIIDFTGSSPASIYGINSPRTYSHAYSVFGLKAMIAPHVPNNAGSLSCFDLVTEPGTCVDPIRPQPGDGAPCDRPDAGGRGVRLPGAGAARPGPGGKCRLDLDPGPELGAW